MKNNIVLTGFMGTGKTVIGKKIAKEMSRRFIDTDLLVEEITRMSIDEIFRKHGERRFRSEESLVIEKISDQKDLIISTGGGTVLKKKNIENLRKNGLIFCLYAPIDTICDRVKRRGNRPLLRKENQKEIIKKMLKDRENLYKDADFFVDTSQESPKEISLKIIENFKKQIK